MATLFAIIIKYSDEQIDVYLCIEHATGVAKLARLYGHIY